MNDFIDFFEKELSLPNGNEMRKIHSSLSQEEEKKLFEIRESFFNADVFEKHFHFYVLSDFFYPQKEVYSPIKEMAERKNINADLFFEYVYIFFAQKTYEIYKAENISTEIFISTMSEVVNSVKKYYKKSASFGIDDYMWLSHHLRLNIFKIGCFCYQVCLAQKDECLKLNGIQLRQKDIVLKIHVPDGTDMKKEERLKSYSLADKFFGLENSFFSCDSWLLYPENKNILPKESNIRSFSQEFHIISTENYTHNESLAHITCEKSSVGKAYFDYVSKGGKLGSAKGILLYKDSKIYKE